MKRIFIFIFILLLGVVQSQAQPKKVLLQGFWWDFRNDNYPSGWANYLTDMAPRLREMGVEAVWIPVSSKNANPFSVGYSPFDHYDLGDKFQKGRLKTTFGDKDEFLRMVAVLHANGIDVIQDVVLNHCDQAGSGFGEGGQDPAALSFYAENLNRSNYADIRADPTNGTKTFRYSSYSTPALNETAANYLARNGRWSKNWQNFHPNPADNRFSGEDLTRITFGPDISFNAGARGLATNATFNPNQADSYMRTEARNWMVWLKKQTGVDGWRLDAIKHFPAAVCEDVIFNTQFNAAFANGGNDMFTVGEWVGGANEMDAWVDAVLGRAGTFDFSLRGFSGTSGLVEMVYGLGNYNIGNLPGTQQNRRGRTVPFVNNHDTFRPPLLPNGNYPTARWNSGSELSANIDPREPRLAAAYAVAMAVDGTPQIFFEDLFDIGTRGNRYNHRPNDTTLPVRDDIAFLTKAHKVMDWKGGAYLVPNQSPDHLIIERNNKAIIGINDNWNTWQGTWITTSFPAGTRLIDYAGSSGSTDIRVVAGDRRVQISTPPCNGTARRRGFSVWGPVGLNLDTVINVPTKSTQQEWEMADDLGDSHQGSLQQGGALPALSTAKRIAGKIYPASGSLITYRIFSTNPNAPIKLMLTDYCGRVIDSIVGVGNLTKEFTAITTGWHVLKAQHTSNTVARSNRCWINVTYTAPRVVDARADQSIVPVDFDLGIPRSICVSDNLFSAPSKPNSRYLWTLPDGTTNINGQIRLRTPGRYILQITNTRFGCVATDTLNVLSLIPTPISTITQRNDSLFITPQQGMTYTWRRGTDTLVIDSTTTALPITTNGEYFVSVRSKAGCGVSTRSIQITNLKETLTASEIEVYPNPNNGSFKLTLPERFEGSHIIITDLQGKNIFKTTLTGYKAEINQGKDLASGMYLIRIEHSRGTGIKKLAIK
jgi:alpha-amylase